MVIPREITDALKRRRFLLYCVHSADQVVSVLLVQGQVQGHFAVEKNVQLPSEYAEQVYPPFNLRVGSEVHRSCRSAVSGVLQRGNLAGHDRRGEIHPFCTAGGDDAPRDGGDSHSLSAIEELSSAIL